MKRVGLLLALTSLLPWVRGAAVPEGEMVGQVWAGHPVSFGFLVERGHQFIAYYDSERKLTVVGRRIGDADWTRIQPEGVPVTARKRSSNQVGWDSHNYLTLALDRTGCLHLAGNMHVDPLVYYRSELPFAVASLRRVDRMVGERETRCTYPVFFRDAAGNVLFRYRDGSSGNGSDLYNRYDEASRSWRRVITTPLLEGEGERNAYASAPQLGPDGRFHLVWMWRETPDCATNHRLSYARSTDLVHWEDSRGRALTLPITLATGEVIDAAKPGEGLINMTFALGFDAAHHPVVAYHRYDARGQSQIFAARPSSGDVGWQVRQVSDWHFRWSFSGGGSIPAEVTVGAPTVESPGFLRLDTVAREVGAIRWRLDAESLAPSGTLPLPTSGLPQDLRRSSRPGLEVHTLVARAAGRRWVLRWETLPRNRDKPREGAPPPSELRLFELPDGTVDAPQRVGS
jgi:hypothetical protein